jgi:hypothetical protein
VRNAGDGLGVLRSESWWAKGKVLLLGINGASYERSLERPVASRRGDGEYPRQGVGGIGPQRVGEGGSGGIRAPGVAYSEPVSAG